MDIKAMGYVVIPRLPFKEFRDEKIYDHLFKRAEYRPNQELELGQTIIKVVELAKVFNWSAAQIKYSLDRMEKQGYIKLDRLPQKRGFIVTILHYADYIQLGNYMKKKALEPAEIEHKEVDDKMKNAFELYENKVARSVGPMEAQRIGYMVDDYGEEKVMEAIKTAFQLKGKAASLSYVQAILSNPFTQKRKEKQYGYKQSSQYRHRIPNDHAGTSGKVSPLFGNKTGRIRRKG